LNGRRGSVDVLSKIRTVQLMNRIPIPGRICIFYGTRLNSPHMQVFVVRNERTQNLLCLHNPKTNNSQARWPRGLRRWSAAARLLGLWVRIPLGAEMSVCCDCCVLASRGIYDGTITLPEKSYQVRCV